MGEHEADRLTALRRLLILDSQPEQDWDDLTVLASQVCATPIALVSLVDEDRQWFKAQVGLTTTETSRELAFCAHAIAGPEPLFTVADATADARFADNALVTDGPRIRFYAGAPIVTDDGHALGTVCVIDTEPRVLSPAQQRCLTTLARHAANMLNLRRRSIEAAAVALEQADMTVEARLKLEKGAELLDLVLQGRELGLWDLDVGTGRWTASAYEVDMLGYTGHDAALADVPWRDLVHPDDRAATTATMGPHLRGEAPYYECTHRMRHRAGHWLWILSRAVVVQRDATGVPLRIVGTHMDVTESRRQEFERRRNAERLELALVGGDVGTWDVYLPTGGVVYNAQWARMLGYTLEEVEARPGLWRELIHPDDTAAFTVAMDAHLRGDLPMLECEGRLRAKDGRWIWVLTRAKVFERDANDRALRLVGVNLNITSRRASEAALTEEVARRHMLLDHANEYIFVVREDFRLTEVNQKFVDVLGHDVDELMAMRPWQWDAIDGDQASFEARWRSRSSSDWKGEAKWRRRDGTTLDVVMSTATVWSAGVEEFVCICHDITESRRDRLALEEASALLEQTAAMARVGGWRVDLVDETIWWSREVYRIHEVEPGWQPTLAAGIDFYAPEARPVIRAAVEDAIANGKTYDLQLPLVTARGRRIWIRTRGRAEYDGARPVRLVGVFQDITERKHAEDALVASERRLRMITDHMPALIMRIDDQRRYDFVNAHFGRVFGIEPAAVIGRSMREICGDAVHADLEPHIDRVLTGAEVEFETSETGRGERLHYQSHYVPDFADDGRVVGFYALIFDVTARRRAELRSIESERRLQDIADSLPACIAELDRDGRFRFANATYDKWLGIDPRRMIGRHVADAIGNDFYEDRRRYIARALAGEAVTFEQTSMLSCGERTLQSTYLPHFDERQEVAGFYALSSDITELKETQRKLDALARIDPLTGLPNRRHFEERADECLARARRTGKRGALLYLDVDHFKSVNDSLGHAGGDQLLQEFARRLRRSLRETDFVARHAGDEFVAIVEGIDNQAEAVMLAQKITAAIRLPFTLSHACVRVTTSIGIATFDGREPLRSLLERADAALYESKSAGRDAVQVSAIAANPFDAEALSA